VADREQMTFMALSDEILQKVPLKIFSRSLQHDTCANSYLFFGPSGSGKERAAFALAKAMHCPVVPSDFCGTCQKCSKVDHFNHPDVHYIFPMPSNIEEEEMEKILEEKRKDPDTRIRFNRASSISITQMRMLQKDLQLKPFESGKRIVIIRDAQTLTEEAANAFLKTLEEPPVDTVIVLMTSQLSSLLPTIVSRCHKIYFRPYVADELTRLLRDSFAGKEEDGDLRSIVAFSKGDIQKAKEIVRGDFTDLRNSANDLLRCAYEKQRYEVIRSIEVLSIGRDKEKARDIFTIFLLWFRDLLLLTEGAPVECLVNRDRYKELSQRVESHSRRGLLHAIDDVDTYRRSLSENVNLTLVLNLFLLRVLEGTYL
jgi:DNA polymerase-3 subunit delta'